MNAAGPTGRAIGIAALAVASVLAVAGCAAGESAPPPAPCPDALIEFYAIVGAVETDAPDAAIYPETAPSPSCSFYFAPQDSTSIVIAEADRADFDAVVAALGSAGYTLSDPIENAEPAPGDAHVQVQLDDGPATGVLMLVEPDPETGFDSVSVVLLALPTA